MLGLAYWFVPFVAGCVWLGTLVAMLGVWTAQGYPGYPWDNPGQHIMFISTLGATAWGKPLFITGSAVMVVLFNATFCMERWFRHKGRLAMNYNITEKILSGFAIAFAIIGGFGLLFLTIFDTRRFPNVHQAMLACFIGGYIISAIFICAEYQRLGMHFREHRILRVSFWIKLTFIFVEGGLAIAFGVLERSDNGINKAAILEWIVSLVYIFYVWSFIIDFLPMARTRNKEDRFGPPIRAQDDEMAMNTQNGGNQLGGPVYSSGGGPYNDASSHGSAVPMAEAPRNVPASRNF